MLEPLLRRRIKFTIVITVVTAYLRSGFVDSASPIFSQKLAGGLRQEEPAILILVDLYVFMRQLPHEQIKIFHRTWLIDLLGNINTAFGSRTETALGFRCDLLLNFQRLDSFLGRHPDAP